MKAVIDGDSFPLTPQNCLAMTSNNGTQDQIPPYGGSAYGQRLLINVIEGTAKHEPDRVYASIPRSNDLAKGFRDVKFPELLQSIDYYAWWIHDNVGCSDTIETVSYIGVQDLRYVVVFFAAVKCGYKVRFVVAASPPHSAYRFKPRFRCSFRHLGTLCP